MHITMVKKQLENGESCRKCAQAEEMLKTRGLWHRIDEIVWAVEGQPDSPGMQLGARLGVKIAPFFIVRDDAGNETVYKSALKFAKEQFGPVEEQSAKISAADIDLPGLQSEYSTRPPAEILRWGLEQLGSDCAISFSGAEDVVLIDMAAKIGRPFSVFTLDTGRLHPETYQFIDKVRTHYGIEIHLMSPEAKPLQEFVRQKGLFSFYDDGHKECCGVRKIEPLKRALTQYRGWVTGQRHDQSPATRAEVPVIELDSSFSGANGPLIKLNPVVKWTSAQVWEYIRENDVPYNELHDRGFISIGCEPCTRASRPGEHERAARWWWEDDTKRECGLHVK